MDCAFYRFPKVLLGDSRYSAITTDAKILYALLLDRAELSSLNNWCDDEGEIYIYYTVQQASEALNFCNKKVIKLFRELESIDLIERRRQGRCKPSKIYLKKFYGYNMPERQLQNSVNDICGSVKKADGEVSKVHPINTEYNHTEISDTDLSINMVDWEEAEERVKMQIEYDILSERSEYNRLDEIVAIMTEVMCVCSPTIRIGSQEYPREYVQHRFSQLDSGHMEYIHDRMDWTKTRIKNIKAYLLTALFEAPATMKHYYQAEVKADLGY